MYRLFGGFCTRPTRYETCLNFCGIYMLSAHSCFCYYRSRRKVKAILGQPLPSSAIPIILPKKYSYIQNTLLQLLIHKPIRTSFATASDIPFFLAYLISIDPSFLSFLPSLFQKSPKIVSFIMTATTTTFAVTNCTQKLRVTLQESRAKLDAIIQKEMRKANEARIHANRQIMEQQKAIDSARTKLLTLDMNGLSVTNGIDKADKNAGDGGISTTERSEMERKIQQQMSVHEEMMVSLEMKKKEIVGTSDIHVAYDTKRYTPPYNAPIDPSFFLNHLCWIVF